MTAYYNEIDPYAAQWLRNLIAAGHIAPGEVDERSIEDVKPDDIKHYTQCHFFAGIGVWSYALRRAGWPDDKPVWTGSCPCQPFSSAGKGGGFDDERHLWPAFFHLIEQCRPSTVFGEQVASKDGLGWLDTVQADLEGADYASAAVDICAAGVGAPHIRQRLFWVANSNNKGLEGRKIMSECPNQFVIGSNGMAGGLEHANMQHQLAARGEARAKNIGRASEIIRLADTASDRQQFGSTGTTAKEGREQGFIIRGELSQRPEGCTLFNKQFTTIHGTSGTDSMPTNGLWRDADWLLCRDGKWRPVEPGAFPLAHGITNRVGRLRAYGNAINAEAAKVFIESYMDIIDGEQTDAE
ncbi:Modification methylase HhaI [Pragia fontium]|uniref:DNA cytosine methyltransferase n=1 Tax=Pragia fontium TaxID=82985 RepID=UPI000DFFB946|nr:DNA cytosine methyltransferase [Pragia fontium]SUB81988.1 Modification methylase HhaI [Pragia fontium]